MSFSFKEHAVGFQSEEQTLLILTYEVSKVVQCAEAATVYGSVGYKAHAMTEMGDVISMLRYYCEMKKVDYDQLSFYPIAYKDNTTPGWIVTYLGKIIQAHHYTNVFGSTLHHEKLLPALAMFKKECMQYCCDQGWDFQELEKLGEAKYLDRMNHIKKDGLRSKL
jgi:hypothetical protein